MSQLSVAYKPIPEYIKFLGTIYPGHSNSNHIGTFSNYNDEHP